MTVDERVRIRVRGERAPHGSRRAARAEPRHGIAREVTLHTGERIHLADIATIAHATPQFRDRHDPRLAVCAHQFGYHGHCLTKSRRYATTFTALRQARHDHAARAGDEHAALAGEQLALEVRPPGWISSLRYAGQGHFTAADALLAASAASRAREQRRAAREEGAFSRRASTPTDEHRSRDEGWSTDAFELRGGDALRAEVES